LLEFLWSCGEVAAMSVEKTIGPVRKITWSDLGVEPFRIFFPLGVLAAIVGALLWPLHLWGINPVYPGQAHARIMACGLFGAFILGFLGTALPRLISAPPLGTFNVLVLAGLHTIMLGFLAFGKTGWGDAAFIVLLVWMIVLMLRRAARRQDLPPPYFVLAALAFLCAIAGAAIGVWNERNPELDPYWVLLRRLLSYQGFVLLPILGVGPFFLPRLFGLKREDVLPEMRWPNAAWWRKATLALGAGGIVIASFFIELAGWYRTAHAIRFVAVLGYVLWEFPFRRAGRERNALALSVQIGFAMMLSGYLAVALFPAYRVALLHLAFASGFGIIAFTVATRVAYGHSGRLRELAAKGKWLGWAVGIILFATATRVSGDFWPKIMASHFIYGAWVWIIGVAIWAARVLPRLLEVEED
jgi:uncharacterized protein involved in response to NO